MKINWEIKKINSGGIMDRGKIKYIGFLFAILLISGIYYAKADLSRTTITVQDPTGPTSLGSIDGQIWEDLNANGIRDIEQAGIAGDEVVLPGWKVNLKGKDTANKPVNMVTTSDDSGHYYFSGLNDGNYVVKVISPKSWVTTTASEYDITIKNGSEIYGQNFGSYHKGKIEGNYGKNKKKKSAFSINLGQLEYQDDSKNLSIQSIKIDSIATTLDKRRAVITGLVKVNGAGSYPFNMYIEDNIGNYLIELSIPAYRYSDRIITDEPIIQIDN